MLKIFIDKLRDEPGTFDLNVKPEELDLADPVFQFENRVHGQFEFKLVGQDVEGKGQLEADATTPCVRCLEPARLHLRVPFHEMWFHRDEELEPEDVPFGQEEPADFSYSGDTLYPAEAFRELILAELPELPLCQPDCKGLCPGCGANLNREPCTCSAETRADSRATAETTGEPEWKRALRELKQDK